MQNTETAGTSSAPPIPHLAAPTAHSGGTGHRRGKNSAHAAPMHELEAKILLPTTLYTRQPLLAAFLTTLARCATEASHAIGIAHEGGSGKKRAHGIRTGCRDARLPPLAQVRADRQAAATQFLSKQGNGPTYAKIFHFLPKLEPLLCGHAKYWTPVQIHATMPDASHTYPSTTNAPDHTYNAEASVAAEVAILDTMSPTHDFLATIPSPIVYTSEDSEFFRFASDVEKELIDRRAKCTPECIIATSKLPAFNLADTRVSSCLSLGQACICGQMYLPSNHSPTLANNNIEHTRALIAAHSLLTPLPYDTDQSLDEFLAKPKIPSLPFHDQTILAAEPTLPTALTNQQPYTTYTCAPARPPRENAIETPDIDHHLPAYRIENLHPIDMPDACPYIQVIQPLHVIDTIHSLLATLRRYRRNGTDVNLPLSGLDGTGKADDEETTDL